MKKILLFVAIVVFAMMLLGSMWPSILTLRNNSGEPVHLYLTGYKDGRYNSTDVYYFMVKHRDTKVFEITRGYYSAEVVVCGYRFAGFIDLTKNLKLTFPNCATWDFKQPKWIGEPGFEKFNPLWPWVPPFQPGVDWRFLY